MSLSDNLYLLIRRYTRRTPPIDGVSLPRYLTSELQSVERSMQTMADAAVTCVDYVDADEKNLKEGMLRYFVNVTYRGNTNLNGLHVYSNTNGWQAVSLASAYQVQTP